MTSLGPILIANRGEIALRIVRACRDAEVTSIAAYADGEAETRFVTAADRSVALGGTAAADTYLDRHRIVAAAVTSGAGAVHPGYGFLAEDPDLADAVVAAGLTWIGPPGDVLRIVGDKVAARKLAAGAGVPVLPATTAIGPEDVAAFAAEHGYPVVVKAARGGGGRGMRVVRRPDDFAAALAGARREAAAAFGRPECFVEHLVERARHVEVQIAGDVHGQVVAVGDRDCTVQRRHQKLIEEAPAPFLAAELRRTLHDAAVAVGRAAGYVGLGTVEFLVSPGGEAWFIEVNGRLQVEHGVTEEALGVDLVVEQLHLAAGTPLSRQLLDAAGAPPTTRHAIEVRIVAEDAAAGFLPSTGTITRVHLPGGPGVRVDTWIEPGSVVDTRFDSLLAKVVAVGRDRPQALARARRALAEVGVDGVATSTGFLRAVLAHPDFATDDGPLRVHTTWVDDGDGPPPPEEISAPAGAGAPYTVRVGGRWLAVTVPGLAAVGDGALAELARTRGDHPVRAVDPATGAIVAPMQATVVRVAVVEGQRVTTGDVVAVVEAMKMEHVLRSPRPGVVVGLAAVAGQSVAHGDVLAHVAEDEVADGDSTPHPTAGRPAP